MPEDHDTISRRDALRGGVAATAATAAAVVASGAQAETAANDPYAEPANPVLPASNMVLEKKRTAVVITDPQIDFLREDGVTWGVVGKSVMANNTVENLERLMSAAKSTDMQLFISPHWYYPTDYGWKFEGALEKVMHALKMFDRKGQLNLDGFENSGADFMPQYKKYIHDGKTVVANPHKVYGPQNNDLVLQLRKQRIDQVILAGMSANLCVEAHLRDLLEGGFEVAVAKDATAAAQVPEGDGYLAALTNFRMLANAVWTTDEAVRQIEAA
ncbi:MAG: isochorismatase family protein [Pseudomonadota bacterium]